MRKLLLLCFILLVKLSWSQDTKFEKLSEALPQPGTATHLVVSCSGSEAAKFIHNIQKLRGVKSLRLEGGDANTDWQSIFKAIDQLDQLTDLHLSYVEMKEVPAGIDSLCLHNMKISGSKNLLYHDLFIHLSKQPALTSLTLDHNDLENIPAELSLVQTITHLEISDNPEMNAEQLASAISKLPLLTHLSLKDNDLEEFPASLTAMRQLTSLDISGNYIEKLPSSISKMTSLDSLALHDNAFGNFSDDVHKITSLKKLAAISVDEDVDEKAITMLRSKVPNVKINVVQEQGTAAADHITPQVKFHANTLVKPPLPDLVVKPSVYTLNAAQGGIIGSSSGTTISIPAGALVDAQGNPASGEVSLSYREFQTPLDILLSGIPMTYDSGGAVNQFETAGMFELYASQGDKELLVKPGTSIDVKMASSDAAPSFNFYALNENSKNWDYLGKAGTIAQQEKTNAKSNAWKIYHQMLPRMYGGVDEKTYDERFADTSYFYNEKKDVIYGARLWRRKDREQSLYAASAIVLVAKKRIKEDKKGIIKFQLSQRRGKPGVRIHDGITTMEDLTFMYEGPMSASEFRKHFIRKRRYNDIRVNYTPGSSEVTIELKDLHGFETIVCSVYSEGGEVSKQAKRKMTARYRAYKGVAKQQQKSLDRDIAKNKASKKKEFAKGEQRAWLAARGVMTKEELFMKKDEWLKYYDQMVAASKEAEVIASGITRNLSISGFGVYNCDQVKRLQNPVKVLASYKNNEGNKVQANTTYVLDRNVRGVLTYAGAYAGLKENEIAFDPSSTQSIMVISTDGKVSVMKGDELKGKTFDRNTEFQVNELKSNLSDLGELKKALGINEQ